MIMNRLLPIAALAALALGSGCSSLAQVVREDAPGFVLKQPALGSAELGRRLLSGQAEVNACFLGNRSQEPLKSWSARTLTYDASGGGKLQADFGSTIQVGAGASGSRQIKLTLRDMSVEKLESLYFDPKGPCAVDDALRARYAAPEGVLDRVITRALRAGAIDITDTTGGAVNLTVKATAVPVGGGVDGKGQKQSSWQGAELYIAHFLEPVKVTLKAAPTCALAVNSGQSCDLAACSVKLDSVGPDGAYGATLTCQDGSASPIPGKLGEWEGQRAGAGVSYTLRVRKGEQLGVYQVEFFRWSVLSTEAR